MSSLFDSSYASPGQHFDRASFFPNVEALMHLAPPKLSLFAPADRLLKGLTCAVLIVHAGAISYWRWGCREEVASKLQTSTLQLPPAHPKHHAIETIKPLMEAHWGVLEILGKVGSLHWS